MTCPADQVITFSFGKNWQSYLKGATAEAFRDAREDIEKWLRADAVEGRTVVDIGCGSGIHSLGFWSLKARRVVSFDVDPGSVEATRSLWEQAGKPSNWSVLQGSVLDNVFLNGLGVEAFHVVYAWGVLHHTGSMWHAVKNAAGLVSPGGFYWLALYAKGPRYPADLALKQRYNTASWLGKKSMEWRAMCMHMLHSCRHGHNPLRLRAARGMNIRHDIVDWLGGLPYEVASPEEVDAILRPKGFLRENTLIADEGGNHIFVYVRTPKAS